MITNLYCELYVAYEIHIIYHIMYTYYFIVLHNYYVNFEISFAVVWTMARTFNAICKTHVMEGLTKQFYKLSFTVFLIQ